MKILFCILVGYLVGSLNPAAIISRVKHSDLRVTGTGNLGATNAMLTFGKRMGALVMLIDITKSFFVFKLAEWMAPETAWIPMAAGLVAVIGHCFPFYMGFKGGKGLAAFAGIVLAYKPLLFLFLLVTGVGLMLIVNYTFILPFYATSFFTIYVAVSDGSLGCVIFATAVSVLIIVKHFGNFLKALRGEDRKVREYIKTKIFNKKCSGKIEK